MVEWTCVHVCWRMGMVPQLHLPQRSLVRSESSSTFPLEILTLLLKVGSWMIPGWQKVIITVGNFLLFQRQHWSGGWWKIMEQAGSWIWVRLNMGSCVAEHSGTFLDGNQEEKGQFLIFKSVIIFSSWQAILGKVLASPGSSKKSYINLDNLFRLSHVRL